MLVTWAICSGLLAFFADDIEGTRQHGSGVVHLVLASAWSGLTPIAQAAYAVADDGADDSQPGGTGRYASETR